MLLENEEQVYKNQYTTKRLIYNYGKPGRCLSKARFLQINYQTLINFSPKETGSNLRIDNGIFIAGLH